jgi:transcriptional regulator with XRE-family HTH domain
MIMAKKQTVLDLRAELGLDQQDIADEAHVSRPTIGRIERGLETTEPTAKKIFYAINRLRKARGWPEVQYDDIDWPPVR